MWFSFSTPELGCSFIDSRATHDQLIESYFEENFIQSLEIRPKKTPEYPFNVLPKHCVINLSLFDVLGKKPAFFFSVECQIENTLDLTGQSIYYSICSYPPLPL